MRWLLSGFAILFIQGLAWPDAGHGWEKIGLLVVYALSGLAFTAWLFFIGEQLASKPFLISFSIYMPVFLIAGFGYPIGAFLSLELHEILPSGSMHANWNQFFQLTYVDQYDHNRIGLVTFQLNYWKEFFGDGPDDLLELVVGIINWIPRTLQYLFVNFVRLPFESIWSFVVGALSWLVLSWGVAKIVDA